MSTWETDELPVLRLLAEHFGGAGAAPLNAIDIAERAGMDEDAVMSVLRRLSEAKPPYVLGVQRMLGTRAPAVTGITERAWRELEQDDIRRQADADREVPIRGQALPPGAFNTR